MDADPAPRRDRTGLDSRNRRSPGDGRRADGPSSRRRGSVRPGWSRRPMSPTPVTWNLPTQPASYSWEATDEEVAARNGLPVESILRFDLNTSPVPPDLAAEVLRDGVFEAPLSEYPPSDYRRLVEAAARAYGVATDELLV